MAPIVDAKIPRMVKIKEEVFDDEGYFAPGWKEQFIPAPTPEPSERPLDIYIFWEGEILFPPVVMCQGFELMQDKFQSFAREFGQLMLSMKNMSQVNI